MSTLIRKAMASDIAALTDRSDPTIRPSYRAILGDEAVDAFLGSGTADRYITENMDRCTVIVRDGQTVGYAVCRENLIDLMMIDHNFHRQGFGTGLLRSVEERLGHRYAELRLESFAANQAATTFYLKNGWLEVSRHVDKDSGVDKIVFQKMTKSFLFSRSPSSSR